MRIMKYKYKLEGKSMLQLKKKGMNFFSSWWKNEPFAKETTSPITIEIDTDEEIIKSSLNKDYDDCVLIAEKHHTQILAASQYAELCHLHFKATGEYFLSKYYTWTTSKASDGHLVGAGSFDPRGLHVRDWYPFVGLPRIGVCSSAVSEDLDNGNLDFGERVKILEDKMERIERVIKL